MSRRVVPTSVASPNHAPRQWAPHGLGIGRGRYGRQIDLEAFVKPLVGIPPATKKERRPLGMSSLPHCLTASSPSSLTTQAPSPLPAIFNS